MSTIPWLRAGLPGDRRATPGATDLRPIDAWLDTVHRLAQGRAAERASLVAAGQALRARLRPAE